MKARGLTFSFVIVMLAACGQDSGIDDGGRSVVPKPNLGNQLGDDDADAGDGPLGGPLGNNGNGAPSSDDAVPVIPPPPDAPVPNAATVDQLVQKDFAALSANERADTRYISIAHLAALSPEDREVVRFGIVKALSSVSTAPDVARLAPLDQAQTVFKLKLSQIAWKSSSWDLVQRDQFAGDNQTTLGGGAVVAKGDWLVFAVTRPEIYDRLLAIPPLESMLESRLGVDKSRANAQYLGVDDSIVTFSGRILERIPIQHNGREGYYWRSYDFLFKGAADRALATADPTFAKGRSVSELIAGEFIFSLPNGMQAYMLSGFGAQHRFDAQAQVAADPRRDDKLVINGESCITCHARGLNMRKDEVRPNFMQNPAIDASTKQRLQQLYPEQSAIDALFQKDNARYAASIKAMGYAHVDREPIGATIDIFKDDRKIRDFRQQRGETDAVFGN